MRPCLAIAFGVLCLVGCKKLQQDRQPKVRFKTVEQAQAHLVHFKECTGCDLSNVEFTSMDLSGVNLKSATLQGCDLTHTNLAGANLEGANMGHCDFSSSTNLSGANLSGADLSQAHFNGAVMTGANFCEATMPDGSKGPPCPRSTTPQ